MRMESIYAFDNTFVTSINTFDEHNELRWAVALDYKWIIPFINPRAGVSISPQFIHRKIMNYPSNYELSSLKGNNYTATLSISTSYFNTRLTPSVFWWYDITNAAHFIKPQVEYAYSSKWKFTLGALIMAGNKEGQGFALFDNKNQVFFKAEYRWD